MPIYRTEYFILKARKLGLYDVANDIRH